MNHSTLLNGNYYTYHLAAVNRDHHTVTSREDIQDQNGHLLAPKGARIDHYFSERIAQRTLLKPLDSLVEVSERLDTKALKTHLHELIDSHRDFRQVQSANHFSDQLNQLIDHIPRSAMLNQQLTVMHLRLPHIYERSLFCAWFSALIAHNCGLDKTQVQNAFVAGLYHKLGLLHLNPAIVNKKDHLSQDEWHVIKSYVVISHLFFNESCANLPEVARAILEHRECVDGTGFPNALGEQHLSVIGQILALADKLYSVRMILFKGSNNTLHDALPFLSLNKNKHGITVYNHFYTTILNARLEAKTDIAAHNYAAIINKIIKRCNVLDDVIVMFELIKEQLAAVTHEPHELPLSAYLDPILAVIKDSGISNETTRYTLRRFRLHYDEQQIHRICEIRRVQIELFYQIHCGLRLIKDALGNDDRIQPHQRHHFEILYGYVAHAIPADNLI